MRSQVDADRRWIFVLGSVLVHASALLYLASFAQRRSPLLGCDAPENTISLELITSSNDPTSRMVAAESELAARLNVTKATRAPVRSRPPKSESTATLTTIERHTYGVTQSSESFATAPSAAAMLASAERSSHSELSQLDLSARSVALAWNEAAEAVTAQVSESGATVIADSAAASEPAGAQELEHFLRQMAHSQLYLAPRRPPHLQRQSDGSYRYRGSTFSARINRDGSVDFADGTAVRKHPRRTRELSSAEKRWFLDATEGLRRQLADNAHAEGNMHARRSLEIELANIIAARPAAKATVHARILSLWQECAAEEDSTRARSIVQEFVRSRLPQSSELGFTDSELDAFNRGQPTQQAFRPYTRGNGGGWSVSPQH